MAGSVSLYVQTMLPKDHSLTFLKFQILHQRLKLTAPKQTVQSSVSTLTCDVDERGTWRNG